jgi:DNA-binding transcriptional ArsR family regulator
MTTQTKESVREQLHKAVLNAIHQQPNRSYGDIAKQLGYSASYVTQLAKRYGLTRRTGRPTTVTDQELITALVNHPDVTYAELVRLYKVSTSRLCRLAKENGIIRFCGRRLGSGNTEPKQTDVPALGTDFAPVPGVEQRGA